MAKYNPECVQPGGMQCSPEGKGSRATLHDRWRRMRSCILSSSPIRIMLEPVSNMQLNFTIFLH